MALKLNGTNSVAAPAYAGADADTGLQCGTDEVNLVTGGTARLYIDSSGQVGIGTTSPTSLLFIRGGAATATISSVTNTANLDLINSTQTTRLGASNTAFAINHNGSERMRIDSSGNVGIGTTSPSSKLDLVGSRSTSANNTITDATFRTRSTSGGLENFAIRHRGASGGISGLSYVSQLIDSGSNGMEIYTVGGHPIVLGTSASERMRIDNSGRLLVGGTNTYHADADNLVVQGTGNVGVTIASTSTGKSNLYFADSTSNPGTYACYFEYDHNTDFLKIGQGNSERIRLDSAGRLMLGTTTEGRASATDNLTIAGSGDSGITIRSGTSNDGAIDFSDGTSGAAEYSGQILYDHASNFMRFMTASSERLRIDSSGNVGIGTTTTNWSLLDGLIVQTANGSAGINIASASSSHNAYLAFGYGTSHADQFSAYVGRVGDDTLVFGTANNLRLRIDSSGRLLSGLTSSSASASAVFQGFAGSSTGQAILQLQVGKNNAATANNENLGSVRFANSDGNIGALISSEAEGQWGSNDYPGRLTFHTTADDTGSTTERMRIRSDGSFRVSTDTSLGSIYNSNETIHAFENDDGNNVCLYIQHSNSSTPYGMFIHFNRAAPDNNSSYFITGQDSSAVRFRIWSDGDIDNHDNSYGSLSDVKLKQDIVDAGSQWDDLKDLRVRKFKFKSDVTAYGDEAKTLIGLVAQEAEAVCPGLVKDNPDLDEDGNDLGTVTKAVRYSVLYMKAIKALQEAQTRIETLETQQADLLARITALEAS